MPQKRNAALQQYERGELQRAMGHAVIVDRKEQGTLSGNFVNGAWRTRELNTIITDTIGVTVAADAVTIPRGVYEVHAWAPAYGVAQHISRLQNTTTAATALHGTSELALPETIPGTSGDGSQSVSFIAGRIFISAATETIELQHQCNTTQNNNGFGIRSMIDVETYAMLELHRVS
jgi:hypothetical protein